MQCIYRRGRIHQAGKNAPNRACITRGVEESFDHGATNLVIIVIVCVFSIPPNLSWSLLLIPLGAAPHCRKRGLGGHICSGCLCARFRDIPADGSRALFQVAFFLDRR
jgi:ABC-type polysaccharide/polyol phosphate export permease